MDDNSGKGPISWALTRNFRQQTKGWHHGHRTVPSSSLARKPMIALEGMLTLMINSLWPRWQRRHNLPETQDLLQRLIADISRIMTRQLSDQMPGGNFWNPNADVIQAAQSCTATNIFCQNEIKTKSTPAAKTSKIEHKQTDVWGQQSEGHILKK